MLEQVQPGVLRKEALDVVVVDGARVLPGLVDEDRVVDLVARVAGLGIRDPLEVAQRAAVAAVVATVAGARCERLPRVVRDEQRDAAWPVKIGR